MGELCSPFSIKMRKYMLKKGLIISFCIILSACVQNDTPFFKSKTSTTHPSSKDLNKKALQKTALRYLCKDNKEVKVTKIIKSKNVKLKSITVTFKGRTQQLTQNISETGKNYTNINWHWYERNNYSILSTSIGTILAEQCVLQE